MRDICYSYEVSTKVPHMRCVLVIEKMVPSGNVSRMTKRVVQSFSSTIRIPNCVESMDGRYYTDSIAYETKRLFYEPRFMEMCKKYETRPVCGRRLARSWKWLLTRYGKVDWPVQMRERSFAFAAKNPRGRSGRRCISPLSDIWNVQETAIW